MNNIEIGNFQYHFFIIHLTNNMTTLNLMPNITMVNNHLREKGLETLTINQICRTRDGFTLFGKVLHSINKECMKKYINQ